MASIHKEGRGRTATYRVRWREGGRGSKLHASPRFDNQLDAAAFLRELEPQLAAKRKLIHGAVVGWGEAVDRYVAAHHDSTPSHLRHVRDTLTAMAKAKGWKRPVDVTTAEVQGMPMYHARCLRSLLRFADEVLAQPIDRRVIAAVKIPTRPRQPTRLLTEAQVVELIEAADRWHPADGLLVHLIACYGHRAQSCIALRWRDVDLATGTITLPVKSGDIHRHPLAPATLDRVRGLPGNTGNTDDPLIVGHLGRPWRSGAEVAGWIIHSLRGPSPGLGKDGKPLEGTKAGVLDLRRYAITHLLDASNGDPRTAASITGHRTPTLLLNTYARTNDARQLAVLSRLVIPGVPRCSQESS